MLEAVPLAHLPTAMVSPVTIGDIFSLSVYSGAVAGLNRALGITLPVQPGFVSAGDKTYMWAGPGAWLVFGATSAELAAARPYAAMTEQTDGRAIFHVAGSHVRDALAKLVPIDLHDSVFPVGMTALTLAGHLNVQIWRKSENLFGLACFRSFANALYEALTTSCLEFESQLPDV